jgi:putative endonuclease
VNASIKSVFSQSTRIEYKISDLSERVWCYTTMSNTPNPWFLYLVRNNRNALYTGITTDVERRFTEHQSSGPKAAKALKGKGPLILEFSYSVADRSAASQLEYRIKKLPKVKKEQLIDHPQLIEEWGLLVP